MTEIEEALRRALLRRREDAEFVERLRRRAEADNELTRRFADGD